MASFIQDVDLKEAVAGMLKQGDIPDYWDQIVRASNTSAYGIIRDALLRRGFSLAQINAWDRGAEFQRDIGLYWSLVKGGGLSAEDPTFIDKLNRAMELEDVLVTTTGIIIEPANSANQSQVGYGDMVGRNDKFSVEASW